MEIPNIWPTPQNPQTRVRVFRIEIERPEPAVIGGPYPAPLLKGHMQEAFEVGNTPFRLHREDLQLKADLFQLCGDSDPEVAKAAAAAAQSLHLLTYVLYLRKCQSIEEAKAAEALQKANAEAEARRQAEELAAWKLAHPELEPPVVTGNP